MDSVGTSHTEPSGINCRSIGHPTLLVVLSHATDLPKAPYSRQGVVDDSIGLEMNLSAITPARLRSRGNQLTAVLIAFGGLAAFILSGYIIHGELLELEFVGVACTVCIIVVTILNNWRNGLMIFFAWLLFEDLVRKYLGNNMAIYFGKDALVTVFYLSFFVAIRRHKIQLFRPPFRVPLLLMVWVGFMQIFNPGSPSIFYGLMGFKLFFFYVPLLFAGYTLLNSDEDLRKFFSLNLLLIIVIGSLGLAQAIIGHTFLNPTVIQEDIRELSTLYRVSPITGLSSYRPNSVFVSTGRFTNFLGLSWLLILGFTGYSVLNRAKGRIFTFIVLIVTAAALILSASRGAFMWEFINSAVFCIAFLWGAPWRTKEVISVLRTIQRTALGLTAAIVLLWFAFPNALNSRLAFYSETMSPDSPYSELGNRTRDYPIANFLIAFNYERWPYGYGIGTSGLGTQYVTRLLHVRPVDAAVESGYGAIIIEQGIVGLILWIIMSVAIIFSAWQVVRELRGTAWFPLAFVIFWHAFLVFFPYTYGGIVAYEDFVLNAYLWLLLGILFRLPEIASSKKFSMKRPTSNHDQYSFTNTPSH